MDIVDRGRRSMATTFMLQKASLSKERRPPSLRRIALAVLLALSSEMMDVVGAFDNSIRQSHARPEDRSHYIRARIKRDNTISSVNQTIISSVTEAGNNTKAPDTTANNENGEGTANDEDDEGPSRTIRTIKLAFGWGIVAIGGLSLFVYAYAFYLRHKYAKEFLQEQMEEKRKVEAFENGDNLSPCWKNSPVEQSKRSSSPTSVRTGNSSENISALGEGTTPFDDDFFTFKSTDDDSFNNELQTAAKVDRHVWDEAAGLKASIDARNKPVRPLAPPTRDIPTNSINLNGPHVENLDEPREELGLAAKFPNIFPSFFPDFRITKRSASPITSDPDDVVLTSGSSTSSSYAGKNSSVETDDASGFEVINYNASNDGMDANLLNPVLDHDDDSFGQHSGTQMSLGTDADKFSPRGFFVIDDESDMRHEYISNEEYEAAVKAAASVLKNSSNIAPSDEHMGLGVNPSDEILQDVTEQLNATTDSDLPALSSSSMSSASATWSGLRSGSTPGSEAISNVFNELKNVSIFLKDYEKKKSRKSKKALEKSVRGNSIYRKEQTHDVEPDPDSLNMSSDPSTLEYMPVEIGGQRKRKRLLGRLSSAQAVGQNIETTELRQTHEDKGDSIMEHHAEVLTSSHQSPTHESRNPTFTMFSEHSDLSNNQEMLRRNNEIPRTRALGSQPIDNHISQSKLQIGPTARSIASHQSMDSEGKFFNSEIESFFSQKEPNISNLLSEAGRSFIQTNSAQQSFSGDVTFNTSVDTQTTNTITSEKGKFNRLGIVPFDPRESGKTTPPNLKQKSSMISVQDTKPTNHQFDKGSNSTKLMSSSQKYPMEIPSNDVRNAGPRNDARPRNAARPKNTASPRNANPRNASLRKTSNSGNKYDDVVPPSNIRVSPRSRIRQREKLFEQRKSAAIVNNNMPERFENKSIDKLRTSIDDPQISMTQAAMTSIQSSSRKFASLFESRLSNEKDEVGQRQHQSESEPNVFARNDLSSNRLQRKPSTRNVGQVKRMDDTTRKMDDREWMKPSTTESVKTAMQSGAQNLITMFESKSPIIPKGNKIWNNRRSAKSVIIRPEKKTQQTNQTNYVPQSTHGVDLRSSSIQNNRGSNISSFSKLRSQTKEDHTNFETSSFTSQKAKSLISIFESKGPASDAPPIFPQSEFWQYGNRRGG